SARSTCRISRTDGRSRGDAASHAGSWPNRRSLFFRRHELARQIAQLIRDRNEALDPFVSRYRLFGVDGSPQPALHKLHQQRHRAALRARESRPTPRGSRRAARTADLLVGELAPRLGEEDHVLPAAKTVCAYELVIHLSPQARPDPSATDAAGSSS